MKTILVVDDEEHYRKDLAFFLSEEGYIVHQASSKEEAKDKLLQEYFDYAIIDIKLDFTTSTGGIDVLRFAKERNEKIKCYILSGFSIEYLHEILYPNDKKESFPESLFEEIKNNYIYKSNEKNYIDAVFEKMGIEQHSFSETPDYHALLIGIQDYNYFSKLLCPIKDCQSMQATLINYYGFSENNIIFLKDPLRKDIFNALSDFKDRLSPKDNLLIFYAGHASWDESIGQGYWLTKVSVPNNRSEWISCADIRDHIKPLKARHILLLNDACFSGAIFRNANDNLNEKIKFNCSRKAITSGELEPVPDKSIFINCLIECLKNNTKRKIFAYDLYVSICNEIKDIQYSKALYGVIRDAGDQGGDFIFTRNKYDNRIY